MKKRIALLLGLLLTIVLLSGAAFAEEPALPAAGDTVDGFTVKSVSRFELLGADVILFEHDKTGAKVMYIANDDTNRVFEITFRTPAENETGVPHVFEHSTLGGSEKYPSKELFFNLSYQTYNTYMNAATYDVMTTYPVASLSEAQLLKYADYYTDSCFHPMIYTDSSIFDEECWRYALDSADDALTYEGTVYSEMLGAYDINEAASFNFLKTLFPGSDIGNCFGGDPDHIPEMTNEDLLTYHQKYYHPSNSLTCLYGDFEDYAAFLKLLDGYFSEYEKSEITIEDPDYTPLTESTTASFQFGVESSADTNNGATVYYGMILENLTDEESDQIDLLTTLIADSTSVFMQNMKLALPTASAGCYFDCAGPEPAVVFYASGVNATDAELFRETVDTSLAAIAENGFDADALDAIIASVRLETLLTGESSSIGTDTIPSIAYYWACTGNEFGYMHYIETLDLFDDYAKDGSFSAVTAKYLIGNTRTALVATEPVAGLKEEKDAALAEKLAEIKANMTEEEISALVEKTAEEESGDGEAESADTAALVSELQAVTVESLPEEVRLYDVTDETENNVRYISAEANVDGVGQTLLMLNASGLSQEQLHYFKLFTDLIGELDTENYTYAQLTSLITRYLYGATIRVSVVEDESEAGFTPYLRVSFIAMDEDMPDAYDLVYELLFNTKLDDAQAVADMVSSIRTSLKNTITNSCYSIQVYRAFSTCDPSYACYNYMNFLDYYAFLTDLLTQLEEDPDTVLANLQAVQSALNNSFGAVVGFGGSNESSENHRTTADAFLAKLNNQEIERQSYVFPEISRREALIVGGSVQYNMVFASYEDLGLETFEGALDAVTALVSDTYLYPMLRDEYGVYSVMHYGSDDGVYIVSYRDPNVKQTFDVYEQLPALVSGTTVSQETIDGYILSSYSGYALSSGELTGALNAILNTLSGIDQTETIDNMKSLKSVTPETLTRYADMYTALIEKGMISTSGSAAVIAANADRYDTVLDPFASDVSAAAAMTDVAEGDWCYDAVTFMVENGILSAVSDEAFGVDEQATMGDMVSAMYIIVGGDGNFDDGVAMLSEYGIVPSSLNADDVVTVGELAAYGNNYCYALGLDAYEGTDIEGSIEYMSENGYLQLTPGETEFNADATATRAQLAYMLNCICGA